MGLVRSVPSAQNPRTVLMSVHAASGPRRTKAHRRKNEGQRRADIQTHLEPNNDDTPRAFQKIPASRVATAMRVEQLSAAEREQLHDWVRSRTSPYRVVVRSRIVLLASRGRSSADIAAQLQVAPATVRLWLRRFEHGGLAALATEAPGRGRPLGISVLTAVSVLEATRLLLKGTRSVRRVAAEAGTSASSVWRIWKRYGLGRDSTRDSIDAALRTVISETPTDGS